MKMRNAVLATAVLAAVLAAGRGTPAIAGPDGEELSKCMVDATTVDDRRSLVRWIFGAAAQNPDVSDIATLQEAQRTEMSRSVAALFERLLTQDCRMQFQSAMKSEGGQTLQTSFGMLVEEAMRGLIEHPSVSAALGGVDKEIDKQKLGSAVQESGAEPQPATPGQQPPTPGAPGPIPPPEKPPQPDGPPEAGTD